MYFSTEELNGRKITKSRRNIGTKQEKTSIKENWSKHKRYEYQREINRTKKVKEQEKAKTNKILEEH